MSYNLYPAYKDSGVEWLGKIPEGWDCKRLKYVARIVMGQSPSSSDVNQEQVGIPFLQGCSEFGDMHPIPRNWCLCPPKIVSEGMLLFSVRAPVGELNWTNQTLGIGRGLCGIESSKNAGFLWYLLVSQKEQLQTKITGSTFEAVSVADVGDIAVTFPPVSTQKAIAAFLDTETARIDGLVKDYEELIALLQEKRQALISHAVTRGLSELVSPDDPEFGAWAKPVKFKDSGVEWLGEIPEGWGIGPIKHFTSATKGAIKTGPFGSQLTSSEMNDSEIKVYNQRTVIDNDFSSGENYISAEKFEELRSFEVFSGDILVTTRGTIGRCAIAHSSIEPGILHPCVLRIQVNTSELTREYLVTIIQESQQFRFGISFLSNSTTIEVIYSDTIANLYIPLPSVEEQQAIATFLDRETAKMDTLVAEAQSAIELLKEHRSALITNAVTGKINVEGVV